MYSNRLAYLTALAVAFAGTNAFAAECEPEKVAEKYPQFAGKVVKIAASPAQPPFAYSNPDNQEELAGF